MCDNSKPKPCFLSKRYPAIPNPTEVAICSQLNNLIRRLMEKENASFDLTSMALISDFHF